MIQIDLKMVDYVSSLARIKLTNDEKNLILNDLNKMIEAFSQIEDIEVYPSQESPLELHKDISDNSLSSEDFIRQTPEREGYFIKVPVIIEEN